MENTKFNNSTDAGRIALCESWAEHIGRSFAHKTYPNSGVTSIGTLTYLQWLEKQRNEETNHIPTGLYFDLIDGINLNETAYDYDKLDGASGTIIDGVSGITNQMLFNCLNANVSSINDFRTQLINTQLSNTSNTQTNVIALFNSY